MEENNQNLNNPIPISPSQPTEQSIPPSFSPRGPKLKLSILIAGIVLSLVLAGAAFASFLLIEKQKPTPTDQNIKPKPTASPSPTPNQTSNWKTFTNSLYGFSFKYPETLPILEDSRLKGTYGVYLGKGIDDPRLYYPISFIVYEKSAVQVKDSLNQNLTFGESTLESKTEESTVDKIGNNEITKAKLTITQKINNQTSESISYIALIPLSDSRTIIAYADVPDKNILDQILPTFQFTTPALITLTPTPTPINISQPIN
ncbi:MAG TPA: hypothetical protein VHE53_01395 [Patescibacteria group bacterium]|nr:hypothetical protein [Patescibacteria group bacterium]